MVQLRYNCSASIALTIGCGSVSLPRDQTLSAFRMHCDDRPSGPPTRKQTPLSSCIQRSISWASSAVEHCLPLSSRAIIRNPDGTLLSSASLSFARNDSTSAFRDRFNNGVSRSSSEKPLGNRRAYSDQAVWTQAGILLPTATILSFNRAHSISEEARSPGRIDQNFSSS